MQKIDNFLAEYGSPGFFGAYRVGWAKMSVALYIRDEYKRYICQSYNDETDKLLAEVLISRYDGGREQGYVFSLKYNGKQKNYAIFSPCQYDGICLMMDDKVSENPDGWGDREWDKHAEHDKEFDDEQCVECAMFILDDMWNTLNKWIKEEKSN
jgi:hypothetical protein